MDNVKSNKREHNEANYLYIYDMASELDFVKKQSHELTNIVAYTLSQIGILSRMDERIYAVKGTKIGFNQSSLDIKTTSTEAFVYNGTVSFFDDLFSKHGEVIFDHRFKGYYKFTKHMMKNKFQILLNKWVLSNKTIDESDLDNYFNDASVFLQKENDKFQWENNKTWLSKDEHDRLNKIFGKK